MKVFDTIIIGGGSMGSAAAYYLSKLGQRVLCLDRFSSPNDLSSHGGESRIIRQAYFEHPNYVPLLQRAYQNWKELEELSQTSLYHKSGILYAGDPQHEIMRGIKESARLYNVPLEIIEPPQLEQRFPAFTISGSMEVIFEPNAGYLLPEKCITSYRQLAQYHDAVFVENSPVISWQKSKEFYAVETGGETYRSKKLVFTAGAWTSTLIPELNDKLKVTRQVLGWFNPTEKSSFTRPFPCWLIADDSRPGAYYGFPLHDGNSPGVKLAHHYPGILSDPDQIDRNVNQTDIENLEYAVHKYFPGKYKSMNETKVCMYTNTPDEHFIIDFLPGHHNDVIIATGFSGHGFKFASVVGEILCDLVSSGKSVHPIEFLSLGRFKK